MSDGRARSGPARFDSTLGAWILSNHADVSAALRDVRLSAVATAAGDAPGHAAVRRTAARDFSPERLAAWCAETAAKHVARIPVGRPVDLVREFAAPWSLALAAKAACPTGGDMEAARLSALAREVFLAAATATDSTVSPRALAASAELAQSLQRATAEASIDVQAFVALTQTLPAFLAYAWLELFQNPEEAHRLRHNGDLMPQAIEELLRLAGPSRAIFRIAESDVSIGAAKILSGERVVLMLAAANRDPAVFANPDRFDLSRGERHLAFGHGTHSCVGASMIRMAAAAATRALLAATSDVELVGDVDWIDGFAIRAPASLHAHIQNSQRPVPIT